VKEAVFKDKQMLELQKIKSDHEERDKCIDIFTKKLEEEKRLIEDKVKCELEQSRQFKSKTQFRLTKLFNSELYSLFISLVICSNLIILSLERYPREKAVTALIEQSNLYFFAFYFAEVLLKLLAMGWDLYTFDRFNLFDLFVVALSLVDVAINLIKGCEDESGIILALRGLRIIRVFRLAKAWKSF